MKARMIILMAAAVCTMAAAAQRIAVLSDVHVSPDNERQARLAEAVDEINAMDLDLVVMNGDLTNEGSDVELLNVKAILDRIRHPLCVVPGNHENNWSQSATRTFTDLWGDDRFAVAVDSLLVVGINCGPYMKMGDGHIKQEDLHWLESTLDEASARGLKILSFNHYPVRQDDIDNWRQYAALLQRYPVVAHINGHYHSWQQYCIGRIPAVMVRALEMGKTHDDFGYSLVTVDDSGVRVDEKRLGAEPVQRYHVGGPGDEMCTEAVAADDEIVLGAEPLWADSASVFTRLAFDADHVYFGTSTGLVKAVDKRTGHLAWQAAVPSGAPVYSRVTPLPGGRVAVPDASGISVLDAATGRTLDFVPSAEGPYVADGIVDGDRYIQGGYKRMECRDAATCDLIWSYDSIANYCQAAPVADGDDLVFGAWDTWLRCVDLPTGRLRWRWSNGTVANQTGPGNVVPVVTSERVIIVAPDRYMTSLDRKTGRQLWRDNSHRYRESLGHSQDMKRVYAKTMDGELVAVDATADDFTKLWVCDMGIGYDHAPCVVAEVDGVVIAGSRRGIVTAVDVASGTVLWQRSYGSSEINGIDIDPTDGTPWISLIEGTIHHLPPTYR